MVALPAYRAQHDKECQASGVQILRCMAFEPISRLNGVPSFNVTLEQTIDTNPNSPDSKALQVSLKQELDVNQL